MVTAYDFTIRRLDKSISTPLSASTAYFTPEIKATMQTLNSGDQVIFGNIKCKAPDGKTRDIGSMTLIIE